MYYVDSLRGFMQMYLPSCHCVFTPLSVLCRDHADGILGCMQMYLPTCHFVFTPLSVLYRDHADGILGFMQMHLPTCHCVFTPLSQPATVCLHLCLNQLLCVYTFVSTCHCVFTPLSPPAAVCLHLCLCCACRGHVDGILGFMQMYLPLCVYTFVSTCRCVSAGHRPLSVLCRGHADGDDSRIWLHTDVLTSGFLHPSRQRGEASQLLEEHASGRYNEVRFDTQIHSHMMGPTLWLIP